MTFEERAAEIYVTAGYRCCSLAEFTMWYVGAQEVGAHGSSLFYRPDYDPGSAVQFCLECHPLAQQELASQGRCVRLDMADPQARERMRRFRERQRLAAAS